MVGKTRRRLAAEQLTDLVATEKRIKSLIRELKAANFSMAPVKGCVDVTDRDWDLLERVTRREPDYQLDRVLAATTLADRVVVDGADLVHDHASDHAAIRFTRTI